MTSTAAMISAIAALFTSLGVFGTGIGFVWKKVDRRLEDLKRDVADCENKHDDCERAQTELRVDQARQGVITRLAVEQLKRIDPQNIVTAQLSTELKQLYPFDERLPEEARRLLTILKGVPYP